MKRLFLVLTLFCLACFNIFSLDFNIAGEFDAYGISAFENADHQSTSTLIQNDLNFVVFSENNSRFSLQLVSLAQLFSANNAVTNNVNQLFIQFPVMDSGVFYVGKKVVNLGLSRKYSLFNRINPVTLGSFSSSVNGTGIIEFDAFFNDLLNFQALLYYGDFSRTSTTDTFSFGNLNGLLKYDLYHYPMTLSALLYAEGFRDFLYGLSGSWQLFKGIFYLDYLYKPYNDRRAAGTLIADSFANNSSLLFGLRYYIIGGVALNYEYLYNGNGFSSGELDDYLSTGNFQSISGYFNVNNWARHNMFLSAMWNPPFLQSMSVGSQFQLLAPTFVDTEYIGFIFSPYASYSFSQNIGAFLSMRFPFGGELSYFDFSNRKQVEVMLELSFRY